MDGRRELEARRLFAGKDGQTVVFSQKGMPFRLFSPGAVFGGVAEIGGTKCRIRIVRNSDAAEGFRNEVRFPDREWRRQEDGTWTNKVPDSETVLVGHIVVRGDLRKDGGKCVFRFVGSAEG